MSPDEFRRAGHALIDWIADYRSRMESLPVMSQVKPGEIRARFPREPPQEGAPLEQLWSALERDVLPGITHWNHPRFFAYFPSNGSLAGVLADLATAGLGAQCMSWQTSPAGTEVEEVVLEWLRQMVGLPDSFTGVVQDTASTATLVALLCARERTTDFGQTRGGLAEEKAPLCVYASDQAHSSVEKAALLAGFGRLHVRAVETDAEHAMKPEALEKAILEDRASGRRPCAVVATVGTTATTAMDPIASIAEIARRTGAWLHVDAAMGGSAMILPECRPLWHGVEAADSLVLNPHKWMGTGMDFSAYYVRDAQHLVRVMSTNPSYLRTAHEGEVKNYRDWGIPLGRRFRALKLWFLVHEQGVKGLQARLRRDLVNARWLMEQVDAAPDWERMAPVKLQTVCLRHLLPGRGPADVDVHNQGIAQRVNASGAAYVTPAVVKGTQLIRVSIGAEGTRREHVEQAWAALQQAARA
ncbi:MAG TPA: pyridoxal-dependent decarboxylase [Myxococcales bacterium]|nr:pyridoxal-dependent decarboxylase [Myxococcales bacterium]